MSESNRFSQFRFSWLDFKLGFRMLARYPGITLVGTVAIAVAIALGTLYFEGLNKFRNPRLPIRDGDRVVTIRNWNAREARAEPRSLYDYAEWREQSKTIENMGAAITFSRNLVTEDGRVEPVRGAEITANAFALMGTLPALGRVLTERDEDPTEPPVIVIGHNLWKSRFASDPSVIDRSVKLGTVTVTIVGVMPEGYAFPVSEQLWAPLRTSRGSLAPLTGPSTAVFGRLAPGASIDAAQTELAAIGAHIAAEDPAGYKDLSPRVTTYQKPIFEGQQAVIVRTIMSVVAGIFMLLLAIMCTNVATLVYARTATRGWELTVRSALGAGRGRIITQLFVEALVLTGVAALLGLAIAKTALSWGLSRMAGNEALPFWINDSISWTTMLWTVALTVLGAAIVGILPALRATRLNVADAMRNEGAARSGLKFGGFWTTVIVVQVGITVALMPLAASGVYEANRFMQRAEGIGGERYLTASLGVEQEDYGMDQATFDARAQASVEELERRLIAEPGVEGVTFADRLPVEDQFKYEFEVDGRDPSIDALHTSTLVQVSRGFFSTFGTSLVAGRDFAPIEYGDAKVMIVNESFVHYAFKDRNAIGQRIKITSGEIDRLAGDDWYEIVGVVKDFGWQLPRPWEQSAMYLPRQPLAVGNLALRVNDPDAFGQRLRQVANEVDPTIRLHDVTSLARAGGGEAEMGWALTAVAWLIGFIVLTLSATGIHALVSFTVARRTREIGIRAALGARTGRIVAGVFSRAFMQIGAGIAAGTILAAVMGGTDSAREIMILIGADVIMLVVGLGACAIPLKRALSIHPTEALRAEV